MFIDLQSESLHGGNTPFKRSRQNNTLIDAAFANLYGNMLMEQCFKTIILFFGNQ